MEITGPPESSPIDRSFRDDLETRIVSLRLELRFDGDRPRHHATGDRLAERGTDGQAGHA